MATEKFVDQLFLSCITESGKSENFQLQIFGILFFILALLPSVRFPLPACSAAGRGGLWAGSPGLLALLTLDLNWGGEAEADVSVTVVRPIPVAVGAATVPGVVVPGATALHAVLGALWRHPGSKVGFF